MRPTGVEPYGNRLHPAIPRGLIDGNYAFNKPQSTSGPEFAYSQRMSVKWEYRVVFVEINNVGFNAGMRQLNEAGADGWEAVGVTES